MTLKTLLLAGVLAAVSAGAAQAIDVKIGVLNDRSGLYADLSGEGAVVPSKTDASPPPPSAALP